MIILGGKTRGHLGNFPPISEAGWTSREKKVPLRTRLKSARRSQIRRFLYVDPHRGENPPQGRGYHPCCANLCATAAPPMRHPCATPAPPLRLTLRLTLRHPRRFRAEPPLGGVRGVQMALSAGCDEAPPKNSLPPPMPCTSRWARGASGWSALRPPCAWSPRRGLLGLLQPNHRLPNWRNDSARALAARCSPLGNNETTRAVRMTNTPNATPRARDSAARTSSPPSGPYHGSAFLAAPARRPLQRRHATCDEAASSQSSHDGTWL